MKGVTALVNYFGSNRMCAKHVGAALAGCTHVTVTFCGGMSELAHIDARTMLVSDLHRHVINLANVLRDPQDGPRLIRDLRRAPFHEDTLKFAQEQCRAFEELKPVEGKVWERLWNYTAAFNYFVCSWMSRAGQAGTPGEFRGGLSVRWDSQGGDSVKRFRSATEALRDWRTVFQRCTFLVMDAFEMLAKAKDIPENGVFCDPPFPSAGQGYKHNAGTGDEERQWHTRLRDALERFQRTRVVCRFYAHEMVEELYPRDRWERRAIAGGKRQTNSEAPEVLLVRNGGK